MKTAIALFLLSLGAISCQLHSNSPRGLPYWHVNVSGPNTTTPNGRFQIALYHFGKIEARSWVPLTNSLQNEMWCYMEDDVPETNRRDIFKAAMNFVHTFPVGTGTNFAETGGVSVDLFLGLGGMSSLYCTDNTVEFPEQIPTYSRLLTALNKVLPEDKRIPIKRNPTPATTKYGNTP